MSHSSINFEKTLALGAIAYDTEVGDWWVRQAKNTAHRKAYYKIALFAKQQYNKPKCIVDYACGTGEFLHRLATIFPNAKIIGLDGSQKMLSVAQQQLTQKGISCSQTSQTQLFSNNITSQVRLFKTALPNFSLPQGKADMVFFMFPNLVTGYREKYYDKHGYLNTQDTIVAQKLARYQEMDPEDRQEETESELYDTLMTSKVVSRHLRKLLKAGGNLIRCDYSNAGREEFTLLMKWRTLFAEGALSEAIATKSSRQWFEYLNSYYTKSKVILDVFFQTQDNDDKIGGYYCSVFKAI